MIASIPSEVIFTPKNCVASFSIKELLFLKTKTKYHNVRKEGGYVPNEPFHGGVQGSKFSSIPLPTWGDNSCMLLENNGGSSEIKLPNCTFLVIGVLS